MVWPWRPNHFDLDPSTGDFLVKEEYAELYTETAGRYIPVDPLDSSIGGHTPTVSPIDPNIADPSTGDEDNKELDPSTGEINP